MARALLSRLVPAAGAVLALAAGLLHEPVGWGLVGCASAVVLCVAGAKRFSR